MELRKKVPKRATQRTITVWVERADIETLKKSNVDVSDTVRRSLSIAAEQLKRGKK